MIDDEMNIFLIEDNDLDVELFKRGIAKLDAPITLTRARDGQEALEALTAEDGPVPVKYPNVILLDINMPRMNGHEFLAAVRADENLRNSRVFVFTTSDSRADIERAYDANANGYIVKPTGLAGLADVVRMLRNFWNICEHPVPRAGSRRLAPTMGAA